MYNVWSYLASYESIDVLKREYKKLNGLDLTTGKAQEISAHFVQGRNYYESASKADNLIKPLLLYYGVLGLTRGLILFCNHKKNESALNPSHGLHAKKWNEVFKMSVPDLSLLEVEISKGTFTEILEACNNIEIVSISLHHEYMMRYVMYHNSFDSLKFTKESKTFKFDEILSRIPDLKETYESVTGKRSKVYPGEVFIETAFGTERNATHVSFFIGKDKFPPESLIKEEFMINAFTNLSIRQNSNSVTNYSYTYSIDNIKEFSLDGEIPPLVNNKRGILNLVTPINNMSLNLLSMLFISAYYCGMLVRYWPTKWRLLTSGNINDLYLPLLKSTVELIENLYPEIILKNLKIKEYLD